MARPIVRETIVERRQAPVRWGAVFAGTFTAVGVWILLELLGTGIGLCSVDVERGANLRGVGLGTGIWSIVAPLVALFVGAVVGARLAGTRDRKIGALHGVVMWGLSSVLGVLAVVTTVGAIASGVARVGGAAVSVAGSAAKIIAPVASGGERAARALGIDTDELLAPMNDYLKQLDKPAITADQVASTVRGVVKRGLREGKIDRDVLVDEIASATSLSKTDAEDLADRFADRYEHVAASAQKKLDELGERAKLAALHAARATGRAMLWSGIGLLVALIAAVLGGALGVPRRREIVVESEAPPVPPVVVTSPPVP
jgi:hypothetical protein